MIDGTRESRIMLVLETAGSLVVWPIELMGKEWYSQSFRSLASLRISTFRSLMPFQMLHLFR